MMRVRGPGRFDALMPLAGPVSVYVAMEGNAPESLQVQERVA
jgi:hypothetical protein